MRRGACPVCGSTTSRKFYCHECVNRQVLQLQQEGEGRQPIAQLRATRDGLLDRLQHLLACQEAARQQQVRRWQLQQQLNQAQAKAQRAKEALAKAQRQLEQLAASNRQRRATLEQLGAQTVAARSEVLGSALPTVLRYQQLTLSHVSAMLAREQRTRLRELLEIFPLRINAVRSSGGPIQITVCNLRLPEGSAAPPGGWPEPQATSAALGYLLLFADKVGLIMGGPMLHESAHQGSTSSVWAPASFWNRQPPSPGAVLPLHVVPAGGAAGAGAGQAAFNAATGRYLAAASFWGPPPPDGAGAAAGLATGAAAAAAAAAYAAAAAFTRATGIEGTAAGYSTSGPGPGAAPAAAAAPPPPPPLAPSGGGGGGSRREASDFKAAWDLLQRSLACFLKDKAARNGMQLPAAWNPLAWLVVYCAVVKKDSRQDGKLVAASHRADAAAAEAAASAAGAVGDGQPEGGQAAAAAAAAAPPALDGSDLAKGGVLNGLAPAPSAGLGAGAAGHGWTGAEEDDEDEEDEGWGVVQTPFLPPPPSQPEQVEHWARAMFADGNALARGGAAASAGLGAGLARAAQAAGGGGGGAAVAAASLGSSPGASGGMLPVERIRSLFGK